MACKIPLFAAALLLLVGSGAQAVDKSFSGALKHIEIRSQGSQEMGSRMVPILVGLSAVLLIFYLYRRRETTRKKGPRKEKERVQRVGFGEAAARLGFGASEARVLRRIAARLAPQRPQALLSAEAGRRELAGDIAGRIRRRQREIEILQGLLGKLGVMQERILQDRESVRVEADLSVWVIPKKSGAPGEEEGEDLFDGAEQIGGKLLDLSEGGAALCIEMDAGKGDLIEFWSADSEVWLPPVTAAVLRSEGAPGARRVLHLHFADPPLAELRAAIQTLQMNERERLEALDG